VSPALLPFLEKNWPIVLVMIASGLMLLWPFIQRLMSPVREVGTLDATRLMNNENAVVLDVREPKEVTDGRLPNAVHIPLSQLKGRVQELAKSTARPVIVYCDRGQRGRGAAGVLGRNGFSQVYLLRGGYRAWRDAGLPVQKA
jgi:rhodanese-related sulfurtransferase